MFRYTFPLGIFEVLSDQDAIELACSCRQLAQDICPLLRQRKQTIVHDVLQTFHSSPSILFSLHRSYHEHYYKNLKRLFRLIPEWFEYLEQHKIGYLDLTVCYLGLTSFLDFYSTMPHVQNILDTFLYHLSKNTTLTYCNLSIFLEMLTRDRIYDAVKDHPRLSHLELFCSMGYQYQSNYYQSLYRVSDGTLKWSLYPPPN